MSCSPKIPSAAACESLGTVPGVGPGVARTLLVDLPELAPWVAARSPHSWASLRSLVKAVNGAVCDSALRPYVREQTPWREAHA